MEKNIVKLTVIFILCLGLLVFGGCGIQSQKTESKTATAEKCEIYISAAASLTDALKEIGGEYEKANPNVKINYNFGSSGALAAQIEQGAPADVFISAAPKQMNDLDKKALLLTDTRINLLENKVVVIAPKDSKLELASFEDIASDKVRKIALGEPKGVPVGQYSEEIFTSLNILAKAKAKAAYASDVRQVLSWVEKGEVDLGLVYATDAAVSKAVKVLLEAPVGSHKPVIYPVAVLKSAKHEKEAKAFASFLQAAESKTVFEKYGFKVN
ncbi:MAG: molybdate ABC transporter substrate-binding protein [Pelosinus sp.]|nr:molybdate ABC transporter substrate-binding protein [Pelosinus sp.]